MYDGSPNLSAAFDRVGILSYDGSPNLSGALIEQAIACAGIAMQNETQ